MLKTSVTGGKRVICAMLPDRAEDLEHIKELVESGHIKTIVDKRYPMDKAVDAHRYIESGESKGNVIISIGELS